MAFVEMDFASGGSSNIPTIQNVIVSNNTSSDKSVNFTTTQKCSGKVLGLRGSSVTTVQVLKGSEIVYTFAISTLTGVLQVLDNVELEANTTYSLVIKGLSNTASTAYASISYC